MAQRAAVPSRRRTEGRPGRAPASTAATGLSGSLATRNHAGTQHAESRRNPAPAHSSFASGTATIISAAITTVPATATADALPESSTAASAAVAAA